MDETPGKAGHKEKGQIPKSLVLAGVWRTKGSNLYSVANPLYTTHQAITDFKGVLLTNGYGVYDNYCKKHPEITQAQCWVHCRNSSCQFVDNPL